MKKTVIKRRKRVPAAPGGSPVAQDRVMTDQAAAEVLASVGRMSSGAAPPGVATTEDSAEDEGDRDAPQQPRRKRARKSKANQDDDGMDVDDGEGGSASVGPSRGRKGGRGGSRRASAQQQHSPGNPWAGVPMPMGMPMGMPPPHGDAGPSSVPMMHEQGPPRPRSAFSQGQHEARYGQGAPRGMPFPTNPQGGFDLPSINAALGDNAPSALRDASSFIRSGSAAGFHGGPGGPSRTQSPLAGPGISAPPPPPPGPPYMLPPPHQQGIGHAHGHSFYAHQPSTPPPPPVPTLQDLQKHYSVLEDSKKWMMDLLDRTERMMTGVKRTIDEMATGSQEKSPQHQHQPLQSEGAQAQPQGSSSKSPRPDQSPKQGSPSAVPIGRSEKPAQRDSVWPVAPPQSPKRD